MNLDAGSGDNCAIATTKLNGNTAINDSCSDTGVHKIVVEIADASGNMAKDSVEIYVTDTVAATYTKIPFTASLVTDSVAVSRANILTNVMGSCFPASLTFTSDTVFTCADAHTNPNYILFRFQAVARLFPIALQLPW